MEARSLEVTPPELAEEQLGFFRWGHIGGRILLTNDAGDWTFLSPAEFTELLAGRITTGHPRFAELQRKAFLREGMDVDALAARIGRRSRHAGRGPGVHVVSVISEGSDGAARVLSTATADRIIELALQTTAPTLTFEIQACDGSPLRNFETVRHLIERCRERNRAAEGKPLKFRLFSNLMAMTEEIAEWLIANDVALTTRLDGPARLHEANLRWRAGVGHAQAVHWIAWFHRRYAELRRDPKVWRVEARPLLTRDSLSAGREIVDEYLVHGLRTIHLRPPNPALFAADAWREIGYRAEEYLEFYRQTLDYILERNRAGDELAERLAGIFLGRMISVEDGGIVDLQSPCGDGSGQLAYSADGRVFPSDAALVVDARGDSLFDLGQVEDVSVGGLLAHPTVRAIAAASLLDAQPKCADCWNKPYCGFSPVYNFMNQGDLFGQRPSCLACNEQLGVAGRLFELLSAEDPTTLEIFRRWALPATAASGGARAASEAP